MTELKRAAYHFNKVLLDLHADKKDMNTIAALVFVLEQIYKEANIRG